MILPEATVELVERDPVAVVRIAGELDMDNVASVAEAVLDLVPADGPGLVVELGGVRYLDSAGVKLLVDLAERLARTGLRLELVVPDDAVIGRVLRTVKLELLVPIHRNVAAAIAAVQG